MVPHLDPFQDELSFPEKKFLSLKVTTSKMQWGPHLKGLANFWLI